VTFFSLVPQWLANGLALGSIYGLVALGFVTIYSVTGVINLAQGEFLTLGALLTVALVRALPLPLAAPLALLLTAAIGAAVAPLAARPGHDAEGAAPVVITIGISAALRGAALLVWGSDPYPLSPFSPGPPLTLGGTVMTRQAVWIVGLTLLAMLALALFFTRTMTGRALRACALNPTAARLVGIPLGQMSAVAFALGAGLAALAGVVIAPVQYASYDMGLMLGLKGFVAAISGGISSPIGAVAGGLLLGTLEAVSGGVNSALKDVVAFVVLIVVLVLRRASQLRRGGLRWGKH
jgi:branched-chain amino acid transport system permease protein